MATVGSVCEVHMQLKGLVDAKKEISRLEESIAKKASDRDKHVKTTQSESYEEKVRRSLSALNSHSSHNVKLGHETTQYAL